MHLIKSSREYHEVYQFHQKRHGALFVFLWNGRDTTCKAYGIVVSRKVGCAVIRNKVKRRVRAYLRENPEILPQGKLVIIARKESGKSTWAKITADLQENLQAFN
ncbi:MAG: ribonuclease P protein component [Candidatus Cloacimonetes bacterium]|nr:ribonuclease P protein component [Candidatus Cloacimonadota bacterium]